MALQALQQENPALFQLLETFPAPEFGAVSVEQLNSMGPCGLGSEFISEIGGDVITLSQILDNWEWTIEGDYDPDDGYYLVANFLDWFGGYNSDEDFYYFCYARSDGIGYGGRDRFWKFALRYVLAKYPGIEERVEL